MMKDALPNGGAERQLALLVKYLPREWERRVWTMAGGPFVDVIEASGHRVDVAARAARLDPRPAVSLLTLIAQWRPDVVHSWDWMSSLAALPACRLLRIPLVDGDIRSGIAVPRRRRVRKLAMAASDVVLANSHAGLAAWGMRYPKGRVLYNGFDPERLDLCRRESDAGAPFTAVMTGRMAPQKDYSTVIRAAREAVGRGRPWRFVLVGSGPDRERLRNEADGLVGRGAVEFVDGGVEVLPIVRRADVGVLLSRETLHREGCSNAIMEYMACGLPVVCSAGGGNPELVAEGETGYLVPSGDWRSLCDRLERLADRPDEAAAMGAAGRRRIAAEFTVDRAIGDLVRLYDEQRRARPSPPGTDGSSATMSTGSGMPPEGHE
jgi:glycosyltransferase involved in cell wall biosynthesis